MLSTDLLNINYTSKLVTPQISEHLEHFYKRVLLADLKVQSFKLYNKKYMIVSTHEKIAEFSHS